MAFNTDHNDYYQYCCPFMTQDVMGVPSEAVKGSRLTALRNPGKIHLSAWCQQQGSPYKHWGAARWQLTSSWLVTSPSIMAMMGQGCVDSAAPSSMRKWGSICCWHWHPPGNNCTPSPAPLGNGMIGPMSASVMSCLLSIPAPFILPFFLSFSLPSFSPSFLPSSFTPSLSPPRPCCVCPVTLGLVRTWQPPRFRPVVSDFSIGLVSIEGRSKWI